LPGNLDRHSCLADSGCAGQRHKPGIREYPAEFVELLNTTDERRWRDAKDHVDNPSLDKRR